ncbi:MAG: tyrosine-type recombinase/integrase [Syntrophomonadaceae bacterium]|jgi:integrase/recombinase XerD
MNNKLCLIDNHDIQVIGMFLDTKSRRSPLTADVYRGAINEFFKYMNYKSLGDITYADLVEYSNYLASVVPGRNPPVLSISTQNRKIATLKSLFKYAMRIGYIPFNPAEPLETQRADQKIAQRILTDDELLSIIEAAKNKSLIHLLIVYFFACTGSRESELANLMWRDFFLGPGGEICVSITGKQHKTRVLKIIPSLWELIIAYRRAEGLSTKINPRDKSAFIPNRFGNNYTRQTIWKMVKECVDAAGIDKNASPHWIRHTYATSVAKDGTANLWRLQHDLGHAAITTTQTYVHVARGMQDTSVDHVGYLKSIKNRVL